LLFVVVCTYSTYSFTKRTVLLSYSVVNQRTATYLLHPISPPPLRSLPTTTCLYEQNVPNKPVVVNGNLPLLQIDSFSFHFIHQSINPSTCTILIPCSTTKTKPKAHHIIWTYIRPLLPFYCTAKPNPNHPKERKQQRIIPPTPPRVARRRSVQMCATQTCWTLHPICWTDRDGK